MSDRPNIVYILADDMGYGDVACMDPASKIPTPHMDRLAAEGMRFTDAHAPSAVCTPTRYGVLTGRYAWRTRLKRGVLGGYSAPLLEPGRMTVASLLSDHGYATACVGKWHLGLGWQTRPGLPEAERPHEFHPGSVDFAKPVTAGPHTVGFDYSYIIPASLDMDPYGYIENGRVTEPEMHQVPRSPRPAFWRGGACAKGFQHETCLLELTEKAVAWIDGEAGDRHPDRPFFLYFPLPSPHTPHVPREPFRGTSGAGNYGDFVAETDWTVGQVMEALARNGRSEDTLVIVTSDNGAHAEPLALEETCGHRCNSIYRGQKSDAWDGGHRIPFIARRPGTIPAASTADATVCLTDLLATCAGIVGAALPEDAGEDSADLGPLLRGTPPARPRPPTVAHSITGQFAVRDGPWKLILCKGSGGWSLSEKDARADAPPRQLYHMADDPRERRNRYEDQPDVVARLTETVERFQREGRSVAR